MSTTKKSRSRWCARRRRSRSACRPRRRSRRPTGARSVAVPASYVGEFGTRFWFGRAQTKKDLFDTTGSILVSRLDYYDMNIFTGEAFSRLDFNNGWFIKGYVGGGGLFGGKLKDEDFPPVVDALFGDAERQQERLADLRQRRRRHQAAPRAGFPCRRVRRLPFPARLCRRHGLHPDRGASRHLRAGDPGHRARHLADQQLALAAPRPGSVGGVRPALEVHGRRRLAALCARSTAPTRISCGSAPIPATSPARSRRTARAGATSSTPSSPIASTSGSAWAPAAATGTWRPRATPISRARWSASTPSRRSCTGGPITSAASSRPTSSSVLTRCSSN